MLISVIPDFIKYDSTGKPVSRLLYLWHPGIEYKQGRGNPAPFSFPNKAPIGTLFTQAQLTAELRKTTQTIPATDLDGHGTACASIAAGNGNADHREIGLKRSEVIGVAPEADIIGISLDAYYNKALSGGYLVNAMSEWLDQVAGERPLVVSNSWGSHWDGHDGNTVSERELDARFSLDKVGRAILFAAGNEGQQNFHSTLNLLPKKKTSVSWKSIYPNGTVPGSTYMRVYYDAANPAVNVSPIPLEKSAYIHGISNQTIAEFIYRGSGTVEFVNNGTKPVKADIYLPFGLSSRARYDFDLRSRNTNGVIGSPGTMRNAITVGSYDWNDNFHLGGRITVLPSIACLNRKNPLVIGDISCYSSAGPTRDGRVKPEIVSPGQYFTSSHSWVGEVLFRPEWLTHRPATY